MRSIIVTVLRKSNQQRSTKMRVVRNLAYHIHISPQSVPFRLFPDQILTVKIQKLVRINKKSVHSQLPKFRLVPAIAHRFCEVRMSSISGSSFEIFRSSVFTKLQYDREFLGAGWNHRSH